MRLQWTEAAENDLESIADHYAKEAGARIAAENILSIIHSVKTLLESPHKSRPGRIPGTRELVVDGLPFLVPYRVKDSVIHVLRVFHTARQAPEHW